MNPLDKFEISIRRKNDKVTAAVPQLGLYATAADNQGALDALERKKAELLEDLTAAGEVESLLAAESAQRTRKRLRPFPVFSAIADTGSPATSDVLWRFTLKVVIVVVLAAITVVITTNLIAAKIETTRLAWQATFQEYTKIGGPQFWSKFEKSLDDLANPKSEMPEDKRQKILSNIRVIRDRWWPFIAEAVPAEAKSK
jgi:hypothetical protein